jgi:hypothetical protein
MKSVLYTVPLKPGMFKAYKAFGAEITGPRKHEYADFLKRYRLNTCKVWHQKIGEKEYVFIYHDAEEDALEGLKGLANSTNPFDRWFVEQLSKCYENQFFEAQSLFAFDARRH